MHRNSVQRQIKWHHNKAIQILILIIRHRLPIIVVLHIKRSQKVRPSTMEIISKMCRIINTLSPFKIRTQIRIRMHMPISKLISTATRMRISILIRIPIRIPINIQIHINMPPILTHRRHQRMLKHRNTAQITMENIQTLPLIIEIQAMECTIKTRTILILIHTETVQKLTSIGQICTIQNLIRARENHRTTQSIRRITVMANTIR